MTAAGALAAPAADFGSVLPEGRWSTDAAVIEAVRYDRSGWRPEGQPVGVVLAESVADVQAVLKEATRTRTPVVVRGAGTGLSGGSAATAGSLVLDVSRLDQVLELSPVDQLAVVQPGVITAALDRRAHEHGLRYAPDPASVEISTIGGNIATNAGGLRCAKYGVTRDSVLGLDVVLADGRLISTGRRTVKGVAGYDLTALLVGSEGTLGVIVGATLRLRPIPPATCTLTAHFDTVGDAAAASVAITAAGVQPSVAELLDGRTLAAIDDAFGSGLRGGALLLVQTDGYGAAVEADVIAAAVAPWTSSVSVTSDPARTDELLAVRRQALSALEQLGRVLIEDVAVPRSRLAEAVIAIDEISVRTGIPVFTLAHAGDGNLHPIIVVEHGRALDEQVWQAAGQIFRLALRLGGTLTGEHGVGHLKRAWLAEELGADSLALQHQIKSVFDPAGILNPGKAL